MSFARTLFVLIDKLCDGQQNNRAKFLGLNGVDFVEEKDIAYSPDDMCLLDVCYKEKSDGKYPVMVYIHGGGFVAGDKHHRRLQSKWLAEQGLFVVNVNYGLCPKYFFPEPLIHLVKALNWIKDNAEKYNLNLDRMMVSGDSAGGYYAAMLANICTNKVLQERLGVSTDLNFKAAVLNCGIYDVGAALNAKIIFDMGTKILKDFAKIDKEEFETYEWKDICTPIDFVSPEFPKTFITYAEKDFFCGGQGPRMIEKLKENGVYIEEYHSEKFLNNHCFSLGWKGKAPVENNKRTVEFIKKFVNEEL